MTKKDKNGTAAVMSAIIPGLGQIYKGRMLRAVGIWAAMFVGFLMLFLPAIAVYVWNIYDAYKLVEE